MQNGTMMQYFHWYYPNDGSLWKKVRSEAKSLANLGVNAVWLPPAYKASEAKNSAGYDVYDLYDLGEFDQKGSVRTKYGTRDEYGAAIDELHQYNIQVYADIVLNHMGGGDEIEVVKAIKMDPENRLEAISAPYDIEAYTKFKFPGRNGKYSKFKWNHLCFTGVDYDHRTRETAIFNILNKHGNDWEEMVSDEKGNYDYLMYCDIEFRNPAVRNELKQWGKWYVETAKLDGFRLDAVKHISPEFYNDWLDFVRKETGKELFAVAEYWSPGNLTLLETYIHATDGRVSLFDAALHHNLHHASKKGKDFNLCSIFDNSLVNVNPQLAVTVAENHDTQPLQSLEAPLDPWFKPIAYALILLREKGYPCVFFPDLYSTRYTDTDNDGQEHEIYMPGVEKIKELMMLRKEVAYGNQHDYFDHPNCIAWTREGEDDVEASGCAVVISNGNKGNKNMYVGKQHAGKIFIDALAYIDKEVEISENGEAEFFCQGGKVSVWRQKQKPQIHKSSL